jgi:hypothetical protein
MIRNLAPKGYQSLAYERKISAAKLNGGPGIAGKIQPTRPARARINPRTISVITKTVSKTATPLSPLPARYVHSNIGNLVLRGRSEFSGSALRNEKAQGANIL